MQDCRFKLTIGVCLEDWENLQMGHAALTLIRRVPRNFPLDSLLVVPVVRLRGF